MPIYKLNGRDLYVELYGNKNNPAIVYFHGGPGASCLDFRKQAENLSIHYFVIIFDQFGVLRSGRPKKDEPFGMINHLKLIEALRKNIGIKTWSVIGHSYGGMLACLYANLYENVIDNVIYECPSFNLLESEKSIAAYYIPYFKEMQDEEGIKMCKNIIKKDYSQCVETIFADIIKILNRVKDEKWRNYLHNVSYEEYNKYRHEDNLDPNLRNSNEHVQKILDERRIYDDYLPLLCQNKKTSLLLCGKYDPVCTVKQIAFFSKKVKNGVIEMFENSGHFPRIEEPEKYYRVISDFLATYSI